MWFTWTTFVIGLVHFVMNPVDRVNFLAECKFLDKSTLKCGNEGCDRDKGFNLVSKSNIPDGCVWQCQSKKLKKNSCFQKTACRSNITVRTNSWFSKSNLTIGEILWYTYYWWHKVPPSLVKHEFKFSDNTLCNWSAFCRGIAIEAVIKNTEKIGGPGVIVEIDESKFGKSK